MNEFFLEHKTIVVFLHVMSGVVWVGGMIAMRYAAHPSFMLIESPAKRLESISLALKKLFSIVIWFIFILVLTGVILSIVLELKHTEYSMFAHIKDGIWSLMAINFFTMMYRRVKADKAMLNGDFVTAKNQLSLIGSFMVPLNIALGTMAIFLGAYLSSNL